MTTTAVMIAPSIAPAVAQTAPSMAPTIFHVSQTVAQRAYSLMNTLGVQNYFEMPMFQVPQRIERDRADWWLYPAEIDYAHWATGEIPVRSVHWPTVATVAPMFDRLFIAHEMPKGAEFTETYALAPQGFAPMAVRPLKIRGVTFAPYAPNTAGVAMRYAPAPLSRAGDLDPILFGVIADARGGVFIEIARWTWRLQ